jgi:hypothetical protein
VFSLARTNKHCSLQSPFTVQMQSSSSNGGSCPLTSSTNGTASIDGSRWRQGSIAPAGPTPRWAHCKRRLRRHLVATPEACVVVRSCSKVRHPHFPLHRCKLASHLSRSARYSAMCKRHYGQWSNNIRSNQSEHERETYTRLILHISPR